MTSTALNTQPIWLGIDLGTQSVRAIAVDDAGGVLGQGSHPLTSKREGDRHEQNPQEWWQATAAACRQAMAGVDAASVRALAVDATSGTMLLGDGEGQALTPGLMYDDMRAVEQGQRINAIGSETWASLGYAMQPSWALPKLAWLLENNPTWRQRPNTRLMHQSDFINTRLVGHPVASDTSNALKAGYDLLRDRWPREVLDKLHVPAAMLPDVVRSGTSLGRVDAEAASLTGIPEGTRVIAGMTDGCASQIGSGALSVGSWNVVLGTTLVFKGVTRELLRDPLGVVYSHRSPDGQWLPGGASSVGAGVLSKHFPDRDLDALSAAAAKREPTQVVAYPLAGVGERFPFAAPKAEGFLLGTPRDEVEHYAALLQGVAFVERLCFDYLAMLGAPVDGEVRYTGGATRSRSWCQLRADVLGRAVSLVENAEPALGMAVLAAAGATGRPVAEVAANMVRVRETLAPAEADPCLTEGYRRLVDELIKRRWLRHSC